VILVFVMMFVVYNIYLILVKPEITILQNQQQGNISKAQDYIYGKDYSTVIVGSSMSNTMKNSFFKGHIFNLSFSGGSSLTGLEIIKQSGKVPKIILIESNIIFERELDHKFVSQVYIPFLWKIREFVPALQEKYQPLNIVASMIKGSVGKSHEELLSSKRNEEVFKNNMRNRLKSIKEPLNNYETKEKMLREYILYFELLGVELYFFELPVAKEIQNSLKYNTTRNILGNKYEFISVVNDNYEYKTSDGIHLVYSSAYKCSKDIMEIVGKINEQ